jgi:damage-control phosphatase, subfamily I
MMSILNMEIASTKQHVTVDERCKSCFLNTYQRLLEKFHVGIAQHETFISFFQETLLHNRHLSSPEIQRKLNKEFCQIIHNNDPFKEEKAVSNQIAKDLYNEWKPKVLSSVNPFDMALRFSIAGNIMDYGANNDFDIYKTINAVLKAPFAIDHSTLLRNKIRKAKRILYLGDNAGEIVFDKLFIEILMHHEVSYAVKNAPILNDVTMTDAKEVGMDLVADVISNGFDAPSTILNKCSKEFLEVYHAADLIISKGQGNFEGLMNENDPRIFFLLMVKCEVIAEMLHVEKGSFVVYHQ